MFLVCFVLKEYLFYALSGFLKLSENMTRLETLKPPFNFMHFSNFLNYCPLNSSLEVLIIFLELAYQRDVLAK